VVFYVQQKYMTPPPNPSMTPEQIQQQAIMKWMMVILFPAMLYPAPSGLTLYMVTSSLIGIIESRRIRRHVDTMDLTPRRNPEAGKPRDALGRAYAAALERAQAKREAAPARTFKKRK
jgi:YidC/Oxa1 family membrane protein insertase